MSSITTPGPPPVQPRAKRQLVGRQSKERHCGTALPSRPVQPTAQESRPTVGRPTICFLSHADTDLLTAHRAVAAIPEGFAHVTALSLGKITTPEHMAALLSGTLGQAHIIIVRILGDYHSLPGLYLLAEHARNHGQHLLLLSGTGIPDAELGSASTVASPVIHEATAYLHMGGIANFAHCLRFLSDHLLMTGFGYRCARGRAATWALPS